MNKNYYVLVTIGIIGIITIGTILAFENYKNSVYPLEEARGILSRIQATNDPEVIIEDLQVVKANMPKEGNPVWIFPTSETDFGKIQGDLDGMIYSVILLSSVSETSAAFSTGMINIHAEASSIDSQLLDVIPYMYASLSNILFSFVWIAALIGILVLLKRKKKQLEFQELSEVEQENIQT